MGRYDSTPPPPPTGEELERTLSRVIRGIARLIERRGLEDEPDRLFEDDPLLAQLLSAAVQGKVATGPRAGQRVLRFGDRVEVAPTASACTRASPSRRTTADVWSDCAATPDGRPSRRDG